MSLKAKIEAVIYASEEPVTLAQLIGLLGEEGQAELDTLASNQLSLDTESFAQNEAAEIEEETAAESDEETAAEDEGPADPDALNAEILDTTEDSPDTTETSPESTTDVSSRPESAPSADAAERPAVEPGDEASATDTPAPDAKSLAAAEKLRARKLRDYFRSLLDQLIADYAVADRGFEIKEVASGFRFATKPEYHDAVRGFVKSLKPPLKLSLQALETLAVVAYKQPITAPEVSEIRGVESAGTLGSLLTRKLIATAGRKQVIGRPILYKTTKDFLLRFGLKDINELPSIEEFERMAGELNEAVQEEIQMEEHQASDIELSSQSESAPSADGVERPADEPAPESGGSPALDELNAVPEPTHTLHETPEDLISDKSTHPEGTKQETE
ncbi:SMC-Scp complex subunit ScpB [Granulicella sp. 5B5]|uniref:SMC-Scp complex subunit ScpB n=1 Tax=Granulicella sp. 5B5 TaxID=1617967 RepID=UPI0015F3D058|nr:SMC-Scp complex subunit ScpB [Granulicella sp. 5B5]QMV18908.1 SMC-Scp complex subunit ScpB [Granulicella sp. 5B5]